MAVSKRLRYEILRRDNHACRYCGGHAPDVVLTVDHVVPVALGGTDDPTNLVAACKDCNAGKSASNPDAPLVDQVRDDMLRWRHAMLVSAEMTMAEREQRNSFREWFRECWDQWHYELDGKPTTLPLPVDWPDAIDRFGAAGLRADDIAEAVDQTMLRRYVRDLFKYFCGVCWTMIQQRQELAAAYLRETSDGA